MNNNQYIAHGADVICHAGKKGMKWGQGKYSKLKGYVYAAKKKIAPGTTSDKDWYDKKTAEAAAAKYQYEGAKRSLDEHIKKNNPDIESTGRWYKTSEGAEKDYQHDLAKTRNSNRYKSAVKSREYAKSMYENRIGGKIDTAINSTKKKAKKAYRIVKTKAGQIFGKPKLG